LTPIAVTGYDGLSGAEATTRAQAANSATIMSQERLDYLKGELGIDVSHHNGLVNWSQAKNSNVKFAFMKLTEGKTWWDGDHYNLNKNINDALANDIILSYYHFAKFGRTSSPTVDGQDDANNFITHLKELLEQPKLPVVLDLEEDCFNNNNDYHWGQISKPNASINEYTEAFIDTMEASGYDVMIYCRTGLIKQWQLENYSKYPFWVARYFDLRYDNPEVDEPSTPKEWKDGWQTWQFTPTGNLTGMVRGNVDLNVMKKDFLEKYT